MTKIAEVYFHLKRISVGDERLRFLGDKISGIAADGARSFYPDDAIVEVRLSEGSLKGWITIGGIAIAAYGVIADYKGFKESIVEINNDARNFGSYFLDRFMRDESVKGSKVYRTERRLKTPGKIKRLIDRREYLERNRSQLTIEIIKREEFVIELILQDILRDVEPSEREAIRKILNEPRPLTPIADMPRVALPTRSTAPDLLLDIFEHSETEPTSDYMRRFKLSDWPQQTPNGEDPKEIVRPPSTGAKSPL